MALALRERSRPPAAPWAAGELASAGALAFAGLEGYTPLGSTPWLLIAAAVWLWWRGPGWRAIGFRRPASLARVAAFGIGVGLGYQFISLYLVEPLLARVTATELPDVSIFRSVIGDTRQLAFWLAMSWTAAAFAEEVIYRGWITTRVAEFGRFSRSAWAAAVVGSSALFGIVHFYQGPSGMIATGLTGLVLGCVYVMTGRNLWACILAHGVMDTTGFVMIYLGVYPGL
jgi:membrane protease YdiL (CAAX protease family)